MTDKSAWPTLGEVKKPTKEGSLSLPDSKKASTSTSKTTSETSSVNGETGNHEGVDAADSKENKTDNVEHDSIKKTKKKRGELLPVIFCEAKMFICIHSKVDTPLQHIVLT